MTSDPSPKSVIPPSSYYETLSLQAATRLRTTSAGLCGCQVCPMTKPSPKEYEQSPFPVLASALKHRPPERTKTKDHGKSPTRCRGLEATEPTCGRELNFPSRVRYHLGRPPRQLALNINEYVALLLKAHVAHSFFSLSNISLPD